jgi:hypothetical protein
MDPELRRGLNTIREMVARRHQSPTKEWPLVFVEELDELLVIREWPGGTITAYMMSRHSNVSPEDR